LDRLRATAKGQHGFGYGKDGEPETAVHLIPIGFKLGKLLVRMLAQKAYAAAIRLDNLQVFVVHPDQAGKVSFAFEHLLGLYGEEVAGDLVSILLAQVADV